MGCQHYYINILLLHVAIKQITVTDFDKAGDKVLLSDNYQMNLTTVLMLSKRSNIVYAMQFMVKILFS